MINDKIEEDYQLAEPQTISLKGLITNNVMYALTHAKENVQRKIDNSLINKIYDRLITYGLRFLDRNELESIAKQYFYSASSLYDSINTISERLPEGYEFIPYSDISSLGFGIVGPDYSRFDLEEDLQKHVLSKLPVLIETGLASSLSYELGGINFSFIHFKSYKSAIGKGSAYPTALKLEQNGLTEIYFLQLPHTVRFLENMVINGGYTDKIICKREGIDWPSIDNFRIRLKRTLINSTVLPEGQLTVSEDTVNFSFIPDARRNLIKRYLKSNTPHKAIHIQPLRRRPFLIQFPTLTNEVIFLEVSKEKMQLYEVLSDLAKAHPNYEDIRQGYKHRYQKDLTEHELTKVRTWIASMQQELRSHYPHLRFTDSLYSLGNHFNPEP